MRISLNTSLLGCKCHQFLKMLPKDWPVVMMLSGLAIVFHSLIALSLNAKQWLVVSSLGDKQHEQFIIWFIPNLRILSPSGSFLLINIYMRNETLKGISFIQILLMLITRDLFYLKESQAVAQENLPSVVRHQMTLSLISLLPISSLRIIWTMCFGIWLLRCFRFHTFLRMKWLSLMFPGFDALMLTTV